MSLITPQTIITNDVQNFSYEVATITTIFKNMKTIRGFNVISKPKIEQLKLQLLNKENSINKISKIVEAIDNKNYESIINQIQDLYKTENFANIFFLANELEKAFNVARFVIDEPIVKLRVEDLQQDLFKIKSISSKLQFLPNEKDKSHLNQIINEILKKLEASIYTRDLVRKLGTDEETILKKIKETKIKF